MKTFNNLEECIAEIKRLRIQVDALIQIANENRISPECTLALRSLQMAKSWLGKLLGDVAKTPTPYAIVNKPELIPATTEVAELAPYKFDSNLDLCNSQRNIIETTINDFNDFYYTPNLEMVVDLHNGKVGYPKDQEDIERVKKEVIYLTNNYQSLITQHLHEARFWYGFELQNIKNSL